MENNDEYDLEMAREMAELGCSSFEESNNEDILEFAQKIIKVGLPDGFEAAAMAYAEIGELDEAIKTLEQGVSRFPDYWQNWELLGNYKSDAGLFEEAAEAFHKALQCQDVWVDSVYYNYAVALARSGEFELAVDTIDKVVDPVFDINAALLRIGLLMDLGFDEEALELSDEWLSRDWKKFGDKEKLARFRASRAWLLHRTGTPVEKVRQYLVESIRESPPNEALFTMIRIVDNLKSEYAFAYRLEIIVEPPEDCECCDWKQYYVAYDIAMENEEQAIAWVREFEGCENPSTRVRIARSELLEVVKDAYLGVYWNSGRVYTHENDDD
ncbi:MAG: tetratricopeptide repeat protein [Anaerolineales bacterium]|nr:tetratricopeptide repeat protein [Anaerolineales bacterium]